MYTTQIILYNKTIGGNFSSHGYEYIVNTSDPFSQDDFEDILFEILEIERIYEGEFLIEISQELNSKWDLFDEVIVKINNIILTEELSPYINWEICQNLPPIYKIDRSKSSYSIFVE